MGSATWPLAHDHDAEVSAGQSADMAGSDDVSAEHDHEVVIDGVHHTASNILSGDDQNLLRARILLFRAVAGVLKSGLDLLGVNAPERM